MRLCELIVEVVHPNGAWNLGGGGEGEGGGGGGGKDQKRLPYECLSTYQKSTETVHSGTFCPDLLCSALTALLPQRQKQ
jgi:hypothetical protein